MTWHLLWLAPDPAAPATRLVVDDDGRIVARDLRREGDAAATASNVRTVLVVPGTAAPAMWLPLPARNPVQALAAARALAGDRLASGHRDVHIALGPPGDGEAERLVVAVDPDAMRDWLAHAARLGVKPDAVLPDHLALPVPEDGGVRIFVDGDDWIVRGPRHAFRAEADLAARIVDGLPQHRSPLREEAEALMARGALQPAIDLLQGAFARRDAPAQGLRAWRRAAVLAAALLLSPLLLWTADAVRHVLAARALEARAAAKIDAALPARDRSQPALEAMRAQVAQLRARDAFTGSASALFAAMAQVGGIQLEALSYGPDGVLRGTLVHADAGAAERVRERIAATGRIAESAGSRRADRRVYSEITVRPQEATR